MKKHIEPPKDNFLLLFYNIQQEFVNSLRYYAFRGGDELGKGISFLH